MNIINIKVFSILSVLGLLCTSCSIDNVFAHSEDVDNAEGQIENKSGFLIQLAKKYAPELREHEKEQFPLSNANWFLKKAGLMQVKNGKQIVLIPPGQVTIEQLENTYVDGEPVMRKTGNERELDNVMLYIPKENYEKIAKGEGSQPACYAYPRYVDQGKAIEVSYMFFNPYNGTVGSNIPLVNPILGTLGIGHHEGDWEHITVRLDNTGNTIKGIYYATHGAAEGKWHVTPNTDIKSERGYKLRSDGRPITWSTLDTHGNHNRPGTISREPPSAFKALVKTFGLLVEKTSDKGRHYDCQQILQVFTPDNPSKNHPWLRFRGRWGGKAPKPKADVRGPDGPAFKDWWNKEEKWKD